MCTRSFAQQTPREGAHTRTFTPVWGKWGSISSWWVQVEGNVAPVGVPWKSLPQSVCRHPLKRVHLVFSFMILLSLQCECFSPQAPPLQIPLADLWHRLNRMPPPPHKHTPHTHQCPTPPHGGDGGGTLSIQRCFQGSRQKRDLLCLHPRLSLSVEVEAICQPSS